MTIPGLSEMGIRQHAGESFQRGQEDYRRGAVLSVVEQGDVLQAEVESGQYEPCRVRVVFDAGGVVRAACSCQPEWDEWCRHIVATLLLCLHDPGAVKKCPPLDKLLAALDRRQLQGLLLSLAGGDPGLAEEIARRAAEMRAGPAGGASARAAAPAPPRRAVDPEPVRRQVAAILHSLDRVRPSEAYRRVGDVVDQVRQLLEQARAFIEASDGANALAYLDAITGAYVEGWTRLDDSDAYASGFFATLAGAWTEAALIAGLSKAEREQWADALTRWQAALIEYGVDDAFDVAQAAFLLGWDYPPLQRVLRGEGTGEGVWEDEAPPYAGDLAAAWLKVLQRQGRQQEYLYLAQAMGQVEQYVLALVRLGRVQEAVDEGMRRLHTADQCLALAKALRERRKLAGALRVATHGLTRAGPKGPLATWLCDLALGMGKRDLALNAAIVAFQADPSLELYLRIQELAGDRWPQVRGGLLVRLRQVDAYHGRARAEVFLYEGLWDDAIAAAEEGGWSTLVGEVMDAVLKHRPDWVIGAARMRAENIVEAGRAKGYDEAIGWLARARVAYLATGREAEWRAYLDTIRARHSRKYKLMDLLDDLEGE